MSLTSRRLLSLFGFGLRLFFFWLWLDLEQIGDRLLET